MTSTVLPLYACLPRHPRTGLLAVGWSRRGPVWPIRGAAGDGSAGDEDDGKGGDEDDADEDDDADDGDKGDEDPGKIDWKARAEEAAQAAERWKTLSRKHEKRAKDNAAAVKERDALKRKGMSADDAAIETARTEATAAERARLGGRLVEAEIRGRIGERLDDEQTDSLIDGVNAARFLDEDGDVDAEAVREWVDKIAPKGKSRENAAKGGAGMGQGRGERKTVSGAAAGRARYEERMAARQKQ